MITCIFAGSYCFIYIYIYTDVCACVSLYLCICWGGPRVGTYFKSCIRTKGEHLLQLLPCNLLWKRSKMLFWKWLALSGKSNVWERISKCRLHVLPALKGGKWFWCHFLMALFMGNSSSDSRDTSISEQMLSTKISELCLSRFGSL